MVIKLRKKASRKKSSKPNGGEKLNIRVQKVERVMKETEKGVDVKKEGYVYFNIDMDVNGKMINTNKRIRLDKPERMTNKFLEKIRPLAEREYCENRYFVAGECSPEVFLTYVVNYEDVMDGMLTMFQEVDTFARRGRINAMKTTVLEF